MKNSPLGVHTLSSSNGRTLGTSSGRTVGTFSWPHLGIISCPSTRLCGHKVSDTTVRKRRDEWIEAGVYDAIANE